jgi:hypothetical protein
VGSGVFLDEKTFGVGRFELALPIFEIFAGGKFGGLHFSNLCDGVNLTDFYAKDRHITLGNSGEIQIGSFLDF